MSTNSSIKSVWGETSFPTSKLADIFLFQKTVDPAYTILQGPQKLSTLMRSPPDLSSTLELLRKIPHSFSFYLALLLIPLFLHAFYKAYATPLRRVPGPWIAKFTRLWLLRAINSREYQKINVELHRKYGPVVRISPNECSIDDPDAAAIIYRSRDQLVKVLSSFDQALLLAKEWHNTNHSHRHPDTPPGVFPPPKPTSSRHFPSNTMLPDGGKLPRSTSSAPS